MDRASVPNRFSRSSLICVSRWRKASRSIACSVERRAKSLMAAHCTVLEFRAEPSLRVLENTLGATELEEFLTRPLFAHLSTICAAGPRDSPVWFLWEEGALWIIGHGSFPERIKRDARCAVGIVDFDISTGKVIHVGLRGRATVETFDEERAKRLLRRYLGNKEEQWERRRFVDSFAAGHAHVLVRFVPDDAVARDQSYGVGSQ
jgi:hypothetical protein